MATFLVEVYCPRAGVSLGVLPTGSTRAVTGAPASSVPVLAGHPAGSPEGAHLVGSIFVPEEETCFYLFEAESAEAVHHETDRRRWQFGRVAEVVTRFASLDEGSEPL
jgi:hypothetical protein